MVTYSESARPEADEANIVRLDDVDRLILRLLQQDARMPNTAIAEAVGIAPSTCLARIRSLRERGVIRGFHADIDPAALGRGLQALISVRLHSHARPQLNAFSQYLSSLSAVEGVFFVTGDRDFLLHVAVRDSEALRTLVADTLSVRPEVAGTSTSVIFEYQAPRR
ncbi:Lrp/AsnC family transcriptional regulator [Microterricola pindariensis]|uniref:AsnC family transcriptional regulator n=1 Tax=Microterricola pindariensis TaxID=478010 RepID=A0ABX5AZU7_9MICO|nr:Lrp/AsnC family transcriptional regulator [Microterricola pindariensis]PPL20342.1 AsnC family transcriptional regulator [Microterricola pindariensis]